jgi:parvulin-like peptidyl-prolyl isomerase
MSKSQTRPVQHPTKPSRAAATPPSALFVLPLVLPLLLAPAISSAADPADTAVVAIVGGEKIEAAEVKQTMDAAFARRKLDPASLPNLQAQSLDQVVNRRLVAAYLDKQKLGASSHEVDVRVKEIRAELDQQKVTLESFLTSRKLTEAQLRRNLSWEMGWKKYLVSQTTDQALEAYFKAHRRDFDGTEVRASHILLKVPGLKENSPESSSVLSSALGRAKQLREEIASKKTTFADAAEKYSDGPSGKTGGDLGFFPRRDRMSETFSQAAFALDKGAISQPVVSPFGVHLILCTEIKPGTKTWKEARAELETYAAQDAYLKLVEQIRPSAAIQFTGEMPYFDPVTRKLAPGK